MNKKRIVFGLLSFFLPIFLVFGGLLFFLLLLTSTSDTSKNDCIQPSINNPTDATDTPKSIEQFVKSHKDAYLLSWKAGGFLPSASISQMGLILLIHRGRHFGRHTIWAVLKRQKKKIFL